MIKIKKRIALDYLGEDYIGSYLDFNAIGVVEFEAMQVDIKALENDDAKAFNYMKKVLQDRFVGGDLTGHGAIKPEELMELPLEVISKSFQAITGQPDPN